MRAFFVRRQQMTHKVQKHVQDTQKLGIRPGPRGSDALPAPSPSVSLVALVAALVLFVQGAALGAASVFSLLGN